MSDAAETANGASVERLRARVDAWRAGLPAEDAERLRCVLLFGSRARGDFRPDSDWDILAVWGGDAPFIEPPVSMHDGQPADWVDVDEDRFAAESRKTGALCRLAARRGVVLSGKPPQAPPETGEGMDHKDWIGFFEEVGDKAHRAARAVELAVENMQQPLRKLIAGSADLAERIVKLAMDLKGVDATPVHNIGRLADQLPAGDPWAERLRALNGGTSRDHVADYFRDGRELTPADNDRCLRRVANALRLLRDILDDPELGGAGFDPVFVADEEWRGLDYALDLGLRQWREDVVDVLANVAAGPREQPLVDAMRTDAKWIGAWAAGMADEIRRERTQQRSLQ